MHNINKLVAVGLLLILSVPVLAQKVEEADATFVNPDNINPLAEDACEFLDLDIMQAYGMKAHEFYEVGDYQAAARYYIAYLRYDIGESGAIYNLACCYGLLGEEQLAAENLLRAVKAGFDDIEHIKRDPDFDPVRESEVFSPVMDSLSSIAEAKKASEGLIVHIPTDAYFKTHVQFPADFDEGKTYTLLVGLHGWGADPEGFIKLWERFGKEGKEGEEGEEPDFIYVAPQAPYVFKVGDNIGYSWEQWIEGDSTMTADARLRSEEYVIDVVNYFKDTYNVNKVFLTGFSQGGSFTYTVGIKNHDVFSGIMPLGGWLDRGWIGEDALRQASDLPVFIGYGEKDMRVEFKAAEEAHKKLKKLKYDVTFFTFDGGHSVPEEECQALVEWMRKQEKTTE